MHGHVAEVATGIAALSAVAAWLSAANSRRAITLANRPFVWPAFTFKGGHRVAGDKHWELKARLHNDGPGVALDVRWSVHAPQSRKRRGVAAERQAASIASDPIRAMRSGESMPPVDGEWLGPIIAPFERDEPWDVVVRFSDAAGRRWEFSEPASERRMAHRPRRVRWRRLRRRRGRWW